MSRYILVISFIFFLSGSIYAGKDNYITELKTLKEKIDASYYSWDTAKLKELLGESEKLIELSDDWHTYYYTGLLQIVLGKIYYNRNADLAYDYFDSALENLLKADELTNSAEVRTLISCAYGKKSSLTKLLAIYYGIKAKAYIEDAYKLDKSNSKLFLTAATHLMHTPEAFGGDKDRARSLLELSLKINKNRREKDSLLVQWAGDAELYAYLAQLEILLGEKKKASEYIKKALQLIPDYGYVKYDLAPQLKRIK